MTDAHYQFESLHTAPVLTMLRKLARNGRLLSTTAASRLSAKLGLTQVEIAEALRELHRVRLCKYQADPRGQPVSGYIEVVADECAVEPHVEAWQNALKEVGFAENTCTVLMGLSAKLSDMTRRDMSTLAAALRRVGDLSTSAVEALDDVGFNVSARHIMGSSKVLSMLSQKMLRSLGLPPRMHNSSPRYLIHAGPDGNTEPLGTLLIENPQAFENAIRCGLANSISLVCTYGFGLTYLSQEWLHLDSCLDHDLPIVLPRYGRARTFRALFSGNQIMFWGDLDVAALGIFRAYQSIMPDLQLSGIYQVMRPLLEIETTSHPYSMLYDKAGQSEIVRALADGRPADAAQRLFALCRNRSVDQEAVLGADILQFGTRPFCWTSD